MKINEFEERVKARLKSDEAKFDMLCTFIGIAGELTKHIIGMNPEKVKALPPNIAYLCLLTANNLCAFFDESKRVPALDYALQNDFNHHEFESKLLYVLKQLNEHYKDKLNE